MKLTYNQFRELLLKNGVMLARTMKRFYNIPIGTPLYFTVRRQGDLISTNNENVDKLNLKFGYDFDCYWTSSWLDTYEGLFVVQGITNYNQFIK